MEIIAPCALLASVGVLAGRLALLILALKWEPRLTLRLERERRDSCRDDADWWKDQ